MKAIKVMGKIDDQGHLTLDRPLITNINQQVEVIILMPEISESDDEAKSAILDDFRQSWQEAMTGQTIPVAQLWAGLDDEEILDFCLFVKQRQQNKAIAQSMSTESASSGILDLLNSVKEIQAQVPPEEWDKLPHDGSINTEAYR